LSKLNHGEECCHTPEVIGAIMAKTRFYTRSQRYGPVHLDALTRFAQLAVINIINSRFDTTEAIPIMPPPLG